MTLDSGRERARSLLRAVRNVLGSWPGTLAESIPGPHAP